MYLKNKKKKKKFHKLETKTIQNFGFTIKSICIEIYS